MFRLVALLMLLSSFEGWVGTSSAEASGEEPAADSQGMVARRRGLGLSDGVVMPAEA